MPGKSGLLELGVALALAATAGAASEPLYDIDDVRAAAFVKTQWGQKYAGGNESGGEKCYNYYTPDQCYCGCGPTCLAQIMRYHEWPKTSVDTNSFVYDFADGLTKRTTTTNSYPCKYDGVVTNLTMVGGVYDWSKMPLVTQKTGTPEAEREMIGRLCYDLGVSMCADYNKKLGTGTSAPVAVHALPGNFHYADAAAVEWNLSTNMRKYDQANLERALLPSLDAGLPCGLMIDGTGGRHIVVCDGYGYHGGILHLHLNVGYSGNDDGWYPVEGEWGWVINGHEFTSIAGVVYNISPHFSGTIVSGRIVDGEDRPVVGAEVSVLRDGVTATNVVSDSRGGYVFQVPPGDYAIRVSKGDLRRTVHLTLLPCISSACNQSGDYYLDAVAVRIANRVREDILLDENAEQLAMPTSIPADGSTFKSRMTVELYAADDGAEIRYTLDGSIPDRESTLYTEPFEITRATTVRAIAIRSGAYSSEIADFRFVESTYGELLGTPDTAWTSGGFAPWLRDEKTYYAGSEDLYGYLRSGVPAEFASKGESTWLEAEIEGPAKVSFEYRYNPYYYSPFIVTTDGNLTNVYEKAYYVSSPVWTSKEFEVTGGVHAVRFEYRAGGSGLQGDYNGVHLRNMRIIYPRVLTTSLGSVGVERWSWLVFSNGETSGKTWNQLKCEHAKVTVRGQSFKRELIVDQDASMDVLALTGVTGLVSDGEGKLTVGTLKVDDSVTLGKGVIELTGSLLLMSRSASVIVADDLGIVPVSAVSGGRVVAEKVEGGTRYSLALAYVSPFSAAPAGASAWSAMTFTDLNNNRSIWSGLGADAKARVTLNVGGAASVDVDEEVALRYLMVTGAGAMILRSAASGGLSVEETAVNTDLTVEGGGIRLGEVALADGKTLSVPDTNVFSSVAGAGTLRLTGVISEAFDVESLRSDGLKVVFAGTLTQEGEIRVADELTVEGGADVGGTIVLTDLGARVIVEDGATAEFSSGVKHYEVRAEKAGNFTVHTLVLAKLEYVGPFTAETDAAVTNWGDLVWTDSLGQPGVWTNLAASVTDEVIIVANRDIVIAMDGTEKFAKLETRGAGRVTLLYDGGKDVPAEVKAALKLSSWTGTVSLAGSGRKFQSTELGDYGNAGSEIELTGSISGTLRDGGRCESDLVLNCTVTLAAGSKATAYTFAGGLLGTGEFYFSGTGSDRLFFTGDVTGFAGCVNACYGRTVVYGDAGGQSFADNQVVVISELAITAVTSYHAVKGAVLVYGRLTVGPGVNIKDGMYAAPTPVKLCSPSAQVLICDGCGVTPVSGIAGKELVTQKVEGGTLYCFAGAVVPEPAVEGGEAVGTIERNGQGEYVVSFAEDSGNAVVISDVGTNTVVVPPSAVRIGGVPLAQLRVRYGDFDLTPAFGYTGDQVSGYALSLDGNAFVRIGDELIAVRPSPAGIECSAELTAVVKSVPGLVYRLLRDDTPSAAGSIVATETASGARLTLTDGNPPAGCAFYVIRVEAPLRSL